MHLEFWFPLLVVEHTDVMIQLLVIVSRRGSDHRATKEDPRMKYNDKLLRPLKLASTLREDLERILEKVGSKGRLQYYSVFLKGPSTYLVHIFNFIFVLKLPS